MEWWICSVCYELVNGELQIAEDEAEIIRLIYDKFIHTKYGESLRLLHG